MSTCALCGSETIGSKSFTFWTAGVTGVRYGLGTTKVGLGNFDVRVYHVCEACVQKRKKRMIWTAVAHLALIVLLAVLFSSLFGQFGPVGSFSFALVMAVIVALVPALISVLVFAIGAPASKLKRLARQDRLQKGDVVKRKLRVYSDREYNRLQHL